MLLNFVNRGVELKALEGRHLSGAPEFFIIYGRRRVGKTELVKRFVSGKSHFYFLAKQQPIGLEIERFREKFAEKFNVHMEKTEDLERVFRQILDKVDPNTKFVLVIDEFPYWVSKHGSIISEFQYLWDELLRHRNVFLILAGSSVSVMEHEVLAQKSPLYGRRTGQIRVEPLKLKYLQDFLPKYDAEDLFKAYGAVGGFPFYLKEFRDDLSFSGNVRNTFFNKSSLLYEEAEILLREELREVSTYFNIMKAIDDGATRLGEIASKARVDVTNVNKYISTLMRLGFVRKERPITQPPKLKNFLYVLDDNYFRFWLRYVYPYEEEIEEDVDTVMKLFEADYPRYMGAVFEDICKKTLRGLNLPVFRSPGAKAGRWWHKDKEIDIVAINEQNREVLFAECHWGEKLDAARVLKDLKEKANFVQWNNGARKESYAIFAKSFKKKIKEPGLHLFDLRDLARAMK